MQYDDYFDRQAPIPEFQDGTKLMMVGDEEGNRQGRFTFIDGFADSPTMALDFDSWCRPPTLRE